MGIETRAHRERMDKLGDHISNELKAIGSPTGLFVLIVVEPGSLDLISNIKPEFTTEVLCRAAVLRQTRKPDEEVPNLKDPIQP